MLSKIEKMYLLAFFSLCLYQVIAILIGLSVDVVIFLIRFSAFLSIVIIFLNLYIENRLRYVNNIFVLYIVLILVFLFHLYFYSTFLIDKIDSYGRSSVEYMSSYTLGIVAWTIIGSGVYLALRNRGYNDKKKRITVSKYVPFFSVSLLMVFVISNGGLNEVNYLWVRSKTGFLVSHLTLGSFIIYFLIYLQSASRGFTIYIVLICNILILYMVGGRADTIIYILSTCIYYIFLLKNKKFALIFSTTAIFSLLLIILANIIQIIDLESISRFLSVFSDEDESKVARNQLMLTNISDLPNKIVVGDPNFFIDSHSNLGAYTHNIISLWEFYGFLTFLLVIILVLFLIRRLVFYRRYMVGNLSNMILYYLLVFMMLQILISKPVFYYPFWFFIGYTSMFAIFNSKYSYKSV